MKKFIYVLFSFFLISIPILSSGQVFTSPYFNDFETGSPGWTALADSGSEWELGTPAYGLTSSAHSGNNSWDVDLNNEYTNNTNCILQTPLFNFSSLASLEISFWQNRNCENFWDGMIMEYSTDTTLPWNILGSVNASGSINWYNQDSINSSGLPAWSGNSGGWIKSTLIIPNYFGISDVMFRFRFTTDASVTMDGISIDDFTINETEINSITGTVYLDVNQNYLIDAGDLPYSGIALTSTQGSSVETQTADMNGVYFFVADSGNVFNIMTNGPVYSMVTPSSGYSITFSGSNLTDSGNDFLITFLPDIIDVGVLLNQSVVRPGMNYSCFINYHNQGTTTTSGTISLVYDSAFTFLNASQTSTVTGPNTLEFTYSNLLPGQNALITGNFMTSSTLALGSQTEVRAVIYPLTGDTLIANNFDSIIGIAVNSYDPNNKLVDPKGDITLQQIQNGIDLNYTINFQNTGTAVAFHVNLYDDLSDLLDLNTITITGSSHTITSWSIDVNRLLHFEFANINLPDSNSNEPGSHGYINYRIRPYMFLTTGQLVENQAAIYFDNNAPVLTNTTASNIINPTGINDLNGDDNIFVFPNPTSGIFYLKAGNGIQYSVFNSIGEVVLRNTINSSSELQTIDFRNSPKGMYLIMVDSSSKKHAVKIIVE